MSSVCLSFKVHQPLGLKPLTDDGFKSLSLKDAEACKKAVDFAADNCYLPSNAILLQNIEKHKGAFKVNFSLSGVLLEMLEEYRPDVIDSFRALCNTGCVDIFAETYYNSLSWLYSKTEFDKQVQQHTKYIQQLFNAETKVFRNTELIYNNELAVFIKNAGYKGIFCEGLDKILKGRTPNQTYAAPGNEDFALLLRNVKLSDDIAFRFGCEQWDRHPLTAEKYAGWLNQQKDACNINIFLDYETFGIYKNASTGILEFLEHLPSAILSHPDLSFSTVSEAVETCYPKDIYDVPQTISWEGKDEANCVWCINSHQNNMLRKIYSLEDKVMRGNDKLNIQSWRYLQAADYFYYMAAGRCEGDAYDYINPFQSADEAFTIYKNILTNFELNLIDKSLFTHKKNNHSSTGILY